MFETLYLALFRLFPAPFRRSYQEEALQLFRDRLQDEKEWWPRLRLGVEMVVDLVQSLPQAHRNSYPEATTAAGPGTAMLFRTLEQEPMRREAVALASFLSVGAILLFLFVLRLAANNPIQLQNHRPSAIQSVIERLNPTIHPEVPASLQAWEMKLPAGPVATPLPAPAGMKNPEVVQLPSHAMAAQPMASTTVLNADILSDTQGVDFGPYMKQVLSMVQGTWRVSPPAHGDSETVIRCTFNQAGGVSDMVLVKSSQDAAADQAAWRSITGAGQFPSLPAGFNGPGLTVSLHFSRTGR